MVVTPVDRTKFTYIALSCSAVGLMWIFGKLVVAMSVPSSLAANPLAAASNTLPARAIPANYFVSRPSPAEPTRIANPSARDMKSMPLIPLDSLRQLTLNFEGVAHCQKTTCADASILIQVFAGNQRETGAGFTTADGHYSIQVPIHTRVDEPVDWIIEAYAPASRKLEVAGRRITTENDANHSPILLKGSLALIPKS